MAGEYYKVTEFVRGVVGGRVVVRRPGARIPVSLAMELGLVDAPKPTAALVAAAKGNRRPRKPDGATPPAQRRKKA